ncbi:MAG: RNA polymerase sigma factor [Phycisphaerales bacterium]|nr:RNA polymerase sigma factor [Phycisphaerales bacterium]
MRSIGVSQQRITLQDSDEALLRGISPEMPSGLGELARRYERGLLGLALGLLNGRADLARDAVQETWIRVMRFAASFGGRCEVRTWLYRIAVNQCRDLATWAARIPGELPQEHAPAREEANVAAADETRNELRRRVLSLPADQREVVLLCYHADMTHAAAAEILEIPVGTLKSRLHAALETLRAELKLEDVA